MRKACICEEGGYLKGVNRFMGESERDYAITLIGISRQCYNEIGIVVKPVKFTYI